MAQEIREQQHEHLIKAAFARYQQWSKAPATNFAFLCIGIVVAMFVAPYLREDLKLVAGGELVLLALVRFLLKKQTQWFFWGLLLTGVCLPLTAGATAPIYYSARAGWFSGPFFEMMAIGALVGVPVIAVAAWGLFFRKASGEELPEPPWFEKFAWFFEAAVWIMVFTLSQGQWTPFAVFSVALGAVGFTLGSFLLLVVRLGLGRRGIGNMFLSTGAVSLVVCVVLVLSQGGRVSVEEASAPAIIGAIFLLIGAIVRGPRKSSEKVA